MRSGGNETSSRTGRFEALLARVRWRWLRSSSLRLAPSCSVRLIAAPLRRRSRSTPRPVSTGCRSANGSRPTQHQRARIRIGEIGTVDIAPNTRMQLLTARAERASFESRARVDQRADPRAAAIVFRGDAFERPSSISGCAYTMEVDEAGVGRLQCDLGVGVTRMGQVESLVPAGASCPTRPGIGPGTPAFDDASERLRQALFEFDYAEGGSAAIDVVLAESRQRDTLTLWHLLVARRARPTATRFRSHGGACAVAERASRARRRSRSIRRR